MRTVGFWTPVKYDIDSTTRWQRAREWVDGYFNLRGEVVVICGKELNGIEPATPQPGKAVWWQTALKGASYTAFLFFRAANHLFPGLPLIPGMVVVQTVISCLPIAMLVMKAVLRFNSHFYRYENNPSDLIQPPIKMTLDELLGGYGSVDQLLVYDLGKGEDMPSPDKMTAPIMKGITGEPEDEYRTPSIIIKMRRLSNQEVKVAAFYPNSSEYPLRWINYDTHHPTYPIFFDSATFGHPYLSSEAGRIPSSQVENFKRLQTLIQNGKGTDLNDVEWEIIDHQKNKEINS